MRSTSSCASAYPYSTLERDEFNAVVRMLADGYSTRVGQRGAYLHRDAVNGVLRARRGARLTAITSGGAIPDTADYDVVLEPQATMIGTVNEDFAVESLAGDIFQLGNMSYRILRVERGRVRVEDAQGAPPTIPFWLGEAPGRTDELSHAVSRLREDVATKLEDGLTETTAWLDRESRLRRSRGASDRRVSRRREGRARRAADRDRARDGALLRRIGRHAAHHPFAARQPHQSRVGPRAAQALLPHVQFRTAGRGDRGCDHPVAVDEPQLSARRCRAVICIRTPRAKC